MNNSSCGQFTQLSLLLYTFLLWLIGFVLIFVAIWTLVDPRRSYILDLVDFSEETPLLRISVYIALLTGSLTLFVGSIGCCGAIKKVRCMLVTFIIFLFILLFAEMTIGFFAIFYRNRLMNSNFHERLLQILRLEYGINMRIERNVRITTLVNKLQFYEQCCGSLNATDWRRSRWRAAVKLGDVSVEMESHSKLSLITVPVTCCVQLQGGTPANLAARSLIRCQQARANKIWRHQQKTLAV